MKLLTAVVLAASAAAAVSAQAIDTAQSRAGFMAGCWELTNGTRHVREEWRVVSPDFMISTSTTTDAGALKEFEFQRVQSKGGNVTFIAQPNGAPPTSFALDRSSKPGRLIFTNPQHDFPTRVVYTKTGETTLAAFVDGGEGTRKIEFAYTRCR